MERLTGAGLIFETHHRQESTLRFHSHGMAYATIVLSGSYTEVRGRVPQAVAAGSVIVHSAHEEHADHFLGDAHCLNIELAHDAGVYGSVTIDAALHGALARMRRSFYRDSTRLHSDVVEVQTLLKERREDTNAGAPDWLKPVLEQFDWCDALPLRNAAKLAGVHPVQFSRAFHRHVGITSNDYRRRARLHRASELLLGTTHPLARIAQSCGFADQSHLTRTFGEALGLSPAQYRRIFGR
jgi:AraC-like DNA-binding protein